jgi:carboxyl-terminal processing protease
LSNFNVIFSLIALNLKPIYKNMRIENVKVILAFVAGLGIFSSCQKKLDATSPAIGSTATDTGSVTAKIKDSSLLYAKDLYLWYNQIPSTFNAQNYADPNAIMEAIRAYSNEPGFTAPVDRWSFAYKQTDWDNVSSGVSQDFGLGIFFRASDDLRVKSVESASPAGKAGIRRGWRITKINGSTSITTSDADINLIVKNVFQSNSTSFTFQKPDGTTTNITLNAATYQEHPVILDSVYTVANKKVGYFAFNSFLGDTTEIYNNFQKIFNRFSQQSVQDVIIDLRYNGGGYVDVSEKLADYLGNASADGNLMMTQKYNDKYTRYNTSTTFHKLGLVNLNRVFFIVSNSTASASELLINNLKPYLDVKLVGPSNTYGKPVGFFPVPVGDWYVFPVSFRTTNKNGEGNYFNGLNVDSKVADGLDKDWGDVNEACLASALKYISSGSFRTTGLRTDLQVDAQVEADNLKLEGTSFKGAIGSVRNFR